MTNRLTIAPWGDRELVLRRGFAAPRAQVFAALTRPALVRRWLVGPPGWTLAACEIDARPGGAYRYLWRAAAGGEVGTGGVYREVLAPDLLVHTEAVDTPWHRGEALVSTVLTSEGGGTVLRATLRYATHAAREAVRASPMERGVAAGYDRLDRLLAEPVG